MKNETEHLVLRRKGFLVIASDSREYLQSVTPNSELIEELGQRHVDVFTFVERRWCCPILEPPRFWLKSEDNIALLHLQSYEEWWKRIGKKTRNMVRKAEKFGVKTEIAEPNEKLAEGMWKIYNETPIRQERAFPHYGASLQSVAQGVLTATETTFISALFQDELVGFIQLIQGDRIAIISQILALQKHSDKAINNALIARAVEYCAEKRINWIMYGRIGNHPSLDTFKQNNGFSKYPITRFYIPVSQKGRIATNLGLHRDLKDALPQSLKMPLIPFYNWISRRRAQTKRPD